MMVMIKLHCRKRKMVVRNCQDLLQHRRHRHRHLQIMTPKITVKSQIVNVTVVAIKMTMIAVKTCQQHPFHHQHH